jgi:hypothetical protein
MPSSSTFTAGTDATATAMNNLRTDAIKRDFVMQFELEGGVGVATGQGGSYLVPTAATITKIKRVCGVGSATVTLKRTTSGGSTSTIEAGISTTTTVQDMTTGIDITALNENDKITLDVTAVSSCQNLLLQIFCTYNL